MLFKPVLREAQAHPDKRTPEIVEAIKDLFYATGKQIPVIYREGTVHDGKLIAPIA